MRRFGLLWLKLSYLSSLGAFRAFFFDEAYQFAFGQGLETAALNSGEMNKQIAPAISFNKSEALTLVKPLYSTFRHVFNPLRVFDF
jgi:hypothetical protein